MKVLCIRQPWAALIIEGDKDIENRTWSTNYRGPLLIHASLGKAFWPDDRIAKEFRCKIPPLASKRGEIIGIVDLVDVAPPPDRNRPARGKWHAEDCFGFVLANPRPLPFVPMKGRLNLFDAPPEILRQLGLSNDASAGGRAKRRQ